MNRSLWAFVAIVASGPAVLATSAGATLSVSVQVQRSCTVTRTATVHVTCGPGGVPVVVGDPASTRMIDDAPAAGAPAESTSDAHLHYVTIQF